MGSWGGGSGGRELAIVGNDGSAGGEEWEMLIA